MKRETRRGYQAALRAHVKTGRLNGTTKYIDLVIESFEDMMQGLSESYRNNTLCGIKMVLRERYGLEDSEHELLTYNVERNHIKIPKYLTEEQIFNAVEKLDDSKPIDARDKSIIWPSVCCGLRLSEAAAVKIQHIDFERNMLFIPSRKGGFEHESKLSTSAIDALKSWLKYREGYSNEHDYLWVAVRTGEPLTRDGIRAMYKKRASKIFGRKVTSHMMRHSLVYIMRVIGRGDDWIMAQGGWNDRETFRTFYDSMTPAMIPDEDLPGGRK
jgi:integrase